MWPWLRPTANRAEKAAGEAITDTAGVDKLKAAFDAAIAYSAAKGLKKSPEGADQAEALEGPDFHDDHPAINQMEKDMYPRTNYEMTDDDLKAILDASKPVVAMMIGGMAPRSPQQNANSAWAALGTKMGFDHMTVRPISGKGQRFFTAVPSETEDQRKDRVAKEAKETKHREIDRLNGEIADRQRQLAALQSE